MPWFLATIYDRFMRKAEAASLGDWRCELLARVAGDGLEVGAGTGINLAFYGPEVRRLVMTEPEKGMRARLEKRAAATPVVGLEVVEASSERPQASAVYHALAISSLQNQGSLSRAGCIGPEDTLRLQRLLLALQHQQCLAGPRRAGLRLLGAADPIAIAALVTIR